MNVSDTRLSIFICSRGFKNHNMFVLFNDTVALKKNTHLHIKISSPSLKEHP